MKLALSLKMNVFLGLLSLESNAPFEWTACGPIYAKKQGEVAKVISNYLSEKLGNIHYSWYIPQGNPNPNPNPNSNPNPNPDSFSKSYLILRLPHSKF